MLARAALVVLLFAASARAVEFRDAVEAQKKGDLPRVVEILDEYLPTHPRDVRGYALRGLALVNLQQHERALADANKAIELRPKDLARDYLVRGRAYLGLRKLDEALADLNKAVELAPNYTEAYFYRGAAFHDRGEFEPAISDFHKCIEFDAEHPETFVMRGRCQFQLGVKCEVVTMRNGDQVYPVQRCSLVDRDKVEMAIADYGRALELDANHVPAYEYRSLAYHVLDDCAKALADDKARCRLTPDNAEQLNAVAWRLATSPDETLRDGKTAVEFAERACELSKRKEWRFLDTLAAALAETKRFRRAAEAQQEAIGLLGDDVPAELKQSFVDRLTLYQQRKPYHQPAAPAPPAAASPAP